MKTETVLSRQENPLNRTRLEAQRWLYSRGKKVFALQIVLSMPVMIAVAIVGRVLGNSYGWAVAALSIIVLLIDLIMLSPLLARSREAAARIQEQFDVDVLDLDENQILVGKQVDLEHIQHFALKYREKNLNSNALDMWYSSDIEGLPTEASRIICQRSNLWWDFELRRGYLWLVRWTCIAVGLAILLVFFVLNTSLQTYLMWGFFPLSPLLHFAIRQQAENTMIMRKQEAVKEICETIWRGLLADSAARVPDSTFRNIQDVIFLKREMSLLVFDWYHRLKYKRLREMNDYSIREMAAQYRSSRRGN